MLKLWEKYKLENLKLMVLLIKKKKKTTIFSRKSYFKEKRKRSTKMFWLGKIILEVEIYFFFFNLKKNRKCINLQTDQNSSLCSIDISSQKSYLHGLDCTFLKRQFLGSWRWAPQNPGISPGFTVQEGCTCLNGLTGISAVTLQNFCQSVLILVLHKYTSFSNKQVVPHKVVLYYNFSGHH